MILSFDNDKLRAALANVQVEVDGETPLSQKLAPHLASAEDWLLRIILPSDLLQLLIDTPENNVFAVTLDSISNFVAYSAYADALPLLDLVLTPNGFAVVGNDSLTPASRQRVDALAAALHNIAFRSLDRAIDDLRTIEQWQHSIHADAFRNSLFFSPVYLLTLANEQLSWQRFTEMKSKAIDIEDSLAEEFFSPELMQHLRDVNLMAQASADEYSIVYAIQRQVAAVLKKEPISTRRMIDLVNFIRLHPDSFPLWHSSATAQLFQPHRFENKKEAAGYFF